MYNSGNSSKNVTGASVVDGTLENADFADNGLSGDKIDGGIISNFQSTGIDDRLPTGKILTLSTTGADIDGSVTCDGFTSTGIDDNATSTAITIDSSENVGIGTTAPALKSEIREAVNDQLRLSYNATNSCDYGYIGITVNNNNPFVVKTGGSERMRIGSNGNTTIETGNLVIGTSGKGIDFSAADAALTGASVTAANILDDYEEGTWTGTLKGSVSDPTTAVTQLGQYTKVGRKVYFDIQFNNKNTTGASGGISITGLPFPGVNRNSMAVISYVGATFTGTIAGSIFGSSTITITDIKSGAAWGDATHNPTTSLYLHLSGEYHV
jgi:hypothetical protein